MDLAAASSFHLLTLRARNASGDTLDRYGRTHRLWMRWVTDELGASPDLGSLTLANALRWIAWLQTTCPGSTRSGVATVGLSPENVAQRVIDLKIWTRFLVEQAGCLDRDPLARLHVPKTEQKVIERFTAQQVKLLADLCEQTREKLRNRALILFFWDTGVRVSEVCSLHMEDLEPATAHRHGRARIRGKGSKQRYVYFGVRTWLAIGKYLTMRRSKLLRPAPFVFVRSDGGPLRRGAVEEVIHDLGRRAGLPVALCHPHALRHGFATNYLSEHPGQIEQLRILLGHASLKQVQVYAHLAQADVEGSWSSLVDDW